MASRSLSTAVRGIALAIPVPSGAKVVAVVHPPLMPSNIGVILVSGAGGGIAGPGAVYEPVAVTLSADHGIVALRLDYRKPNNLTKCLEDVEAAIKYMQTEYGVEKSVIVGWSFGGAVALQSAQHFPQVVGVATIASQTAQIGSVDLIGKLGKPLLLLHGSGDTCLSDACSRQIYRYAVEPKDLVIYDGDNHGLTNNVDKVHARLVQFITSVVKAV